jgi:hypothetical protein
MAGQFERRLVFAISERWSGWFCERCCWNRSQPPSEAQRAQLASMIQKEFDAHDCEHFAQQHGQHAESPRQNGTE